MSFVDSFGLWTVALEGYAGLGGGINVHGCGNPFGDGSISGVSFRIGAGEGIQGTIDPLGKAPGSPDVAAFNSSFGFYAGGGYTYGIVGFGANVNLGVSTDFFGKEPGGSGKFPFKGYGDMGLQNPIGVGDKLGLGESWAAGFETTLHGSGCK
jgi:hypothetical protein